MKRPHLILRLAHAAPIRGLVAALWLTLSLVAPQIAAASSTSSPDSLARTVDAPREEIPGVETVYTSVELGDGVRLRVLVTRPNEAEGPLPPLLFTQWVSCGTVEYRAGSGSREILAQLARDVGVSLVRIERAGTGDSEGPACSELGYDQEVRHYVEGFSALLERGDFDTSRVFIFGESLGSTTAPLVADALQRRGYEIAGVAVQGGGALTHFERMIAFERNYLERRPGAVPRTTIARQMNLRARFFTEYLLEGRTPNEIAAHDPQLAAVRHDILGLGEKDHYGRPFTWHQEAAKRDFQGAWAQLKAPVLVIYNEFDQYERPDGHAAIVHTVNGQRPGTATLVVQPRLGHNHFRYPSLNDAYANRNGEAAWRVTADALTRWFRALRMGLPAPSQF